MSVHVDRAKDVRPEIHQMAAEIFEAHHQDLKCPDGEYVRLSILLAFRGDGTEDPPLKDKGRAVVAQVKVIPYDQRVDLRADFEIKLDQKNWDDITEPQQRALLDRCITYIEIQKDDVGAIKTDDAGRPLLKVKQEDWVLKGFRSIAKRYRGDSLEVSEARQWEKDFGKDVLKVGVETPLFANA